MELYTFPKIMSREEAYKVAKSKGGFIWRMVFSKLPLAKLQLHYIEYKLFKLEATLERPFLLRLISKNHLRLPDRKNVLILGNGTTGGAVLVTNHPNIIKLGSVDESLIQHAHIEGEDMLANAKKLAMRVVHRMVGGMPCIEEIEAISIYRPFWVAYYGDLTPGSKARYIMIPADGCSSIRSF
jgi:hypothetical protein